MNLIKGDVSFSVWIDSSHNVRKFLETESTGAMTIVQCTYSSVSQQSEDRARAVAAGVFAASQRPQRLTQGDWRQIRS